VFYVNESDSSGLVTVELSEASSTQISGTVYILGGTATFGIDYYSLSQDVIFEPGEQSKTFEIQILNDEILESSEDISLRLFVFGSSLEFILPGDPSDAKLVIVDDEFLGVSFSKAEESVEEGGAVSIQLLSKQSAAVDFKVTLIFQDIAASTDDYSYDSDSVTFASGETQSSIVKVSTVNDNVWEGLKTLDISMDFPSDQDLNFTVKAIEPTALRVNILDDDAVNISFQAASMSVREDVGVLSLQLVSSGAAYTSPFSVSVVCSESDPVQAEGGSDFIPATHTVEFSEFNSAQTLSSTFEIKIVDNQVTEASESFQCSLLPPSGPSSAGVVVVDPDVISITIEDNDVTVQFSSSGATVDEGASIDIQLTAEGTFDQDFTVNLVFTDGKANNPTDYTYGASPSVTFSAGSASSSVFTVSTVHNNVWKGQIDFSVGFEFPANQNLNFNLVSGSRDAFKANILEVDTVSVSVDSESLSVGEDVGTVSVVLKSENPYVTAFSMLVVCEEVDPPQATAGEDFVATPYTVMFSDFNSQQSLSSSADVVIINDTMAEFTESFKCVISAPDGEDTRGIVIADPNTVTIAIQDNDEILIRIKDSTTNTVDEDSGHTQVFFEALREVSPGVYVPAEYSFDFQILVRTVDGSAKGDSDFGGKEETLTFLGGAQLSNPGPFTVTITDDTVSECTERFNISYSVISSSVTGGASVRQLDSKATVVIEDNDEAIISFDESSIAVVEPTGIVTIRLVADNVFEKEQFVDLSAENGSAQGIISGGSGSGSGNLHDEEFDDDHLDYILLDERVRFPPNSLVSDPFRVQIIDDHEIENYENFYLSFSIPESASSCGAIADENTEMEVHVRDDDGIRVGFLPDEDSVVGVEGQAVILKVYKDGCSRRNFKVKIVATPGTASANDYSLVTKTVTFSAGVHCFEERDVKIILWDDKQEEGIQRFSVFLDSVNHDDVGFDIRRLPVFILESPLDLEDFELPNDLPALPTLPPPTDPDSPRKPPSGGSTPPPIGTPRRPPSPPHGK
jgi:hypothetical protein